MSDFPIPRDTGTFSLLDRIAVETIVLLTERHRFFPGLLYWIGYRRDFIYYDRNERFAGDVKQTWVRLLGYACDALFSFSYVPLRILSYLGILISGISFSTGIFFALRRFLGFEIAFTGFTTIVLLILFLGGLQLLAMGLIGEYIARVYDETKNRPYFIINPKRSSHGPGRVQKS